MRRVVTLRAGPWWHPAVWAVGVVGMNTTFWLALDRIPLAIAVAVSFTGPIGLAAWHSRKRRHVLGVALVALGVLALVHPGLDAVDPIGLALAFANAFSWVLYISAVRRLTGEWSPLSALLAGTIVGSLLLAPGAAATGGLPFDHAERARHPRRRGSPQRGAPLHRRAVRDAAADDPLVQHHAGALPCSRRRGRRHRARPEACDRSSWQVSCW